MSGRRMTTVAHRTSTPTPVDLGADTGAEHRCAWCERPARGVVLAVVPGHPLAPRWACGPACALALAPWAPWVPRAA